jgi:hypothetical protein
MTPSDIISWSLAIGFSWILLSMCLPVERWIELLLQRRAASKALNQRLEELERRVHGKADQEPVG